MATRVPGTRARGLRDGAGRPGLGVRGATASPSGWEDEGDSAGSGPVCPQGVSGGHSAGRTHSPGPCRVWVLGLPSSGHAPSVCRVKGHLPGNPKA